MEITDLMESYERRKIAAAKQELLAKHFLARDIGQFVALVVHGSEQVQIMDIWDFFPELFREEKMEAEKKQKEEQLAIYKAQMLDFMHRHNSRQTGGGGAWKG